jgi:hypothetical protein
VLLQEETPEPTIASAQTKKYIFNKRISKNTKHMNTTLPTSKKE